MPRKAQIANRAGWGAYLKRNWELYLFVVPALIYLLLYCYYPMYGVQIAFKNFRVTKGIAGSEWVGLEHFRKFFSNPSCRALIKNTLVISRRSENWCSGCCPTAASLCPNTRSANSSSTMRTYIRCSRRIGSQ